MTAMIPEATTGDLTTRAHYTAGLADAYDDAATLTPLQLDIRVSLHTVSAPEAYARGYEDGVNITLAAYDAIKAAEIEVAYDMRTEVTQ